MSVTFNTAGLAVGTYPGTIAVTPAGYSLINIAVNLTVSSVPVCPPSNVIQYNTGYQSFTIAPNQTQLWYGTLAADCATSSKQLRFSITQQQNAPNVNMVVKKTNGDCTTPPTIVDYNSLMNQFGYATGTKTPDGVYFEAFSAIATGETLVIGPASAYLSKYPNFGTQADTYYVLLVNTTGSQAAGNINFYCY